MAGNLTYADQVGFGDWEVESTRISVNGRTTSLLNRRRSIIFDSGTSNILFSTSTTEAMYALISSDIQPFDDEPGAYGLPCDRIDGLPAVIDITFTSQQGTPFNLTIPSSELNVGPFKSDPTICQTLINAFDGLDLVGGSVLKHYYSVWDIGNQRMGFAPNGQSRMSQEMNASHRLSSHRFLSGMRVLQTVVMIAMIVRIVKCYDRRTEAGSRLSKICPFY